MAMERYQKVLRFDDVPPADTLKVLRAMIDYLKIEIVQEATPDYVSYEIRPRAAR